MKKFPPQVKLGLPKWENLTLEQQLFTEGLYAKLDEAGIKLRQGLSTMNIGDRFEELKRCQGVIVVGFATWSAERITQRKRGESAVFVSDFVQIYTTLALAMRCPLLVLVEKSITLRGVLRPHFVPRPLKLPKGLDISCLGEGALGYQFGEWVKSVTTKKHVFFGYSSSAIETAAKIRVFLQRIGLSVLDWASDFQPTDTIYSQIESAAANTSCAVFLFTREENTLDGGVLSPKDNLVFEAGYFAAAKGKKNTLIILEEGVSVPDDLTGYIFIPLKSRLDISIAQEKLRKCLLKLLA